VIELASGNNKYVYGSVAEEIKSENVVYDPYEENAVLKSKKIARSNAKLKTKILFSIFLIFGMCAIIMFRYAQITQLNYETSKLSSQYTTMHNENANISIEIKKAMSLINIREIAELKLKMHKPNKSQIVYVDVPKKDVIMLADKEDSKLSEIFNNVKNSLKSFLNIF
jgi:cell division protein FtsL